MAYEFIVEKIDEDSGCKILSFSDREFIVIPRPKPPQSDLQNYINIRIMDLSPEETIIEIQDSEYIVDFFDLISKRIIDGTSIIKILDDVSELFLKQNSKLEKFRGDYAEAAYLHLEGGESEPDGETFDIRHGDDYIEVKSYSPQQKAITISIEQLRENTKKVAYPLRADSNGISIIDLAGFIENSNPEFSRYLIKTYEKEPKLSNKKYQQMKFQDITEQLEFNTVLPKNVRSGKLIVEIIVEDDSI